MRKRFERIMRAGVLTLVCALAAYAQSNAGKISGTVTDSTGGAMPGVTVIATNPATGARQTTKSQENGFYIFPSLGSGTYSVTAEKDGFGTGKMEGIVLDAASARTADFTLQVGMVAQTVAVEAGAQQVETTNAEVSQVINPRQLTDVALNGRNYMQLLRLVSGTIASTLDPMAIGLSTTGQNINGVRSNIDARVDGVANVDSGGNISQRSTPNPDAIAEVKILTSGYNSEYGGRAGALMNVITKSGSRDFHGSLFEFNRNSVVDARNFFQASRPVLHFNDLGGTLGGPIFIPGKLNSARDKLFFFYSLEKKYQHQGTTAVSVIPTLEERAGNFQNSTLAAPIDPTNGAPFPNRTVPVASFSKSGPLLLKPYPAPNFSSKAGNFSLTPIVITDPLEHIAKVDYAPSDKTRIATRYSHAYWWQTNTGGALGIVPFDTPRPSWLASVNVTHSFTPTLLNYFSLGMGFDAFLANAHAEAFSRATLGLTYPEIYPYNLLKSGPNLSIAGFTGYTTGGLDRKKVFDFEVHDDLTKIVGSHSFKAGVMLIRARADEYNYAQENSNGTVTFNTSAKLSTKNAIADVLLGNFQTYTEDAISGFYWSRFTQLEMYAQDTWKVNRRLTLNYGVRYNIHPPNSSPLADGATFVASYYDRSKAPLVSRVDGSITAGSGDLYNGLVLPGSGWPGKAAGRVPAAGDANTNKLFRGLPDGFSKTNWGGFGPRVGFAYDLTGDGKTAIRSGFGIFYDTWQHSSFAVPSRSFPLASSASTFNGNIDNPGAGAALFPSFLGVISTNMKPTHVVSYNINIQRQLPGNFLMDVGYVGTLGRHLPRLLDINQLPVGTLKLAQNAGANANSLRPYLGYSNMYYQDWSDNSNYNALQFNLSRRTAHGLAFGTSFTFGKTMDSTAGAGFIGLNSASAQDVYNVAADRGLSGIHRRAVLSANYQYELPFFRSTKNGLVRNTVAGWTLSGVLTAQSGAPQSVTVPSDIAGIGVASSRASVNGQSLVPDTRTVGQWFNTAAFLPVSQMTVGQFGNSGRNVLIGPGNSSIDLSIYKGFSLHENVKLQFRGESFNTLNHASFTTLGTTVGTATFGSVTAAAPARVVQLGLRLNF